MSSIIVQQSDGNSYDLDECDFKVVSFDPPQIAYNHNFQQIYTDKPVLTQTTVQQATIPLVLMIRAKDFSDYELQVIRLKKIFSSYQPFYVINSRIPYIRYKVVSQGFDVKRLDNFYYSQNVTINLLMVDGCAETVGITSDKSFVDDISSWGYGENIPSTPLKYSFSENKFSFWNLGNIPLKADSRPVLIKFKGDSDNLIIKNDTTGQAWQLKTPVTEDNELDITGMKPVYQGKNVFSNTNHAYLDFGVGENKIEIQNASNFTISFETRFYF